MMDFNQGQEPTVEPEPSNGGHEDRESHDSARLELLRELERRDYRFTSVTPATHARVLRRPVPQKRSLRDILGWNRPFVADDLDAGLLNLLERAEAIGRCGDKLKAEIRVSSLGDGLFLHSGFPTDAEDAVFFGPDTYRFAGFIEDALGTVRSGTRIVDMGTGSGAGGIHCGRLCPEASVSLVDINSTALDFARVNAAAAGVAVDLVNQGEVPAGADLIVANPPYMMDDAGRTYRDGGDLLGGALALKWVREALETLAPGGRMLLYTGVAVTDGRSPLIEAIAAECTRCDARFTWREIDPDVFGEELGKPAYTEVERIAAIGCVISAA